MTEANNSDAKSNRTRWFTGAIIVLMIVLMVFSSQTLRNQNRMQHGVLVGTSSAGDVMSQDQMYASNLLERLSAVSVMVPMGENTPPQPVPLLDMCWGRTIPRELKAHPAALALALREARRISPGTNPYALGPLDPEKQSSAVLGMFNSGQVQIDDLRPLPSTDVGRRRAQIGRSIPLELRIAQQSNDGHLSQLSPTSLPPLDQASYYAAMNDFFTLQAATSLPMNAIKPTRPMIDRMLAQRLQTFSLKVGTVDALQLIGQVPEPTDDQIRAQFAKFADRAPKTADEDHPFDFGYRVPDQLKLEILSFKRDDVRHAVETDKTPYEWEVAARMEFAKNPPTLPTSAPATQPAPTFDSMRAGLITAAIDKATDQRMVEVERAIRTKMVNDYQAWLTASKASGAASPTTAPASAFTSPAYLSTLAREIQAKQKVLPVTTILSDHFRDSDALVKELAGFSVARRTLPPGVLRRDRLQTREITGPEYAFWFARDLIAPATAEVYSSFALDKYKPSERLATETTQGKENEVFIFRITDMQKNQPATDLAAVRETVKSDWRLAEMQKLAMEKASAIVTAIDGGTDFDTAMKAAMPAATIVTTKVGPLQGPPPTTNDLGLTQRPYRQFEAALTDDLLADKPTVAALNVPLASKVFVTQRTGLEGEWKSDDDLRSAQAGMRMSIAVAMSQPAADGENPYSLSTEDLAGTWLDWHRTFDRLAYKPVKEDDATK